MVVGTLAVDGWAVPNATAHPSTASVQTSYYLIWHYNYLWILNGYNQTKYTKTNTTSQKLAIAKKKHKNRNRKPTINYALCGQYDGV